MKLLKKHMQRMKDLRSVYDEDSGQYNILTILINESEKLVMEGADSNVVLTEGWNKPDDKPEYYKPIIMLIETKVFDATHELYIAGYYHTDDLFCESCGGSMDQEFYNHIQFSNNNFQLTNQFLPSHHQFFQI